MSNLKKGLSEKVKVRIYLAILYILILFIFRLCFVYVLENQEHECEGELFTIKHVSLIKF